MNRSLIFATVAVCVCTSASAQTPLPQVQDFSQSYLNGQTAAQIAQAIEQINRQNAMQDQARAINQQVGNALARGDFDEAANIAARAGNIDLYWRIKEMAKR